MPITLGQYQIDRPLWMAPMEGITDLPFRRIVRTHGCGVVATQMIHAEGLLRGTQRRMREVATIGKEESPVGMQLCGSDASVIAEAARKAVDLGADFIDLNMGCPAKNIVNLGSGAALLREPDLAASIVSTVAAAVKVPVTVKIRAGWDDRYRNALEIGLRLQDAGASILSVHARTRNQKFKGKADWNLIAELKKRLSIPVVGNGDVFRPEQVAEMRASTGADGVMVARGALGNPWIFAERSPTVGEIRATLAAHLDAHLSFYENKEAALLTFRKHVVWYTKGLRNAAEFRVRMFRESSLATAQRMIDEFFDTMDPNASPSLN